MAVTGTITMERHMTLALEFVKKGISIKYILPDSKDTPSRDDEIYIEKYRLDACPNESLIMNAIQKKIGRTDIFKSQRNTLGICIMLLLSKGYCINSSVLIDIDDFFIERCWECIQVVSHNIPEDVSDWISDSMGQRSASKFSMVFCQTKNIMGSIEFLNKSIPETGGFFKIEPSEFNVSTIAWHRNDALRQSIILHLTSSV